MGSALDDLGFLKVRGFQAASKSHTGNTREFDGLNQEKRPSSLLFDKEIGDQLLEELRKQS